MTNAPAVKYTDEMVCVGLVAVICLFLGFILMVAALEGADVLPRILVREEFYYDAHRAVVALLLGFAMLAIGGFSARHTWKLWH